MKEIPLDLLILTLTKPSKVILKRDAMFDPKVNEQKKVSPKATVNVEPNNMKLVPHHEYVVGEIVWAKMRGFPIWPAKVCIFSFTNSVFY